MRKSYTLRTSYPCDYLDLQMLKRQQKTDLNFVPQNPPFKSLSLEHDFLSGSNSASYSDGHRARIELELELTVEFEAGFDDAVAVKV